MRLRRPSFAEILLQVTVGLLLAVIVIDYLTALGASACSASLSGRTTNCYPWGMTEGPMEGGSWSYLNKANYLRQGLVLMAMMAIAAVAPFFATGRRSGLTALILIAVAGASTSEWIAKLL